MKTDPSHNLVSISMSEDMWQLVVDAVTDHYLNDRCEYYDFIGNIGEGKCKEENERGKNADFIINLIHMHMMAKWGKWGAE